ncbi:hypothetical protein OAF04_05820 [Flavobacteriaceae bacterium]|nr:hypothetical protein [Flavobacteriaceae bacterium]
MANAVITSNYAGNAALPYVAPAILSGDTIANGYVEVLENVRYKANLRKFDGVALQAAGCEFSNTDGSLTLSDVVLTTTALQVNEQVCNKDLRTAWEANQMRGQSSNSPADFQAFAAQYVAAKVAEGVERNLWQGNYAFATGGTGGTYTSFDGICNLIVAGTPGHEDLLTGATTSSTILGRLKTLSADIPDVLAGDPDTKLYMSRAMKQLYYTALAGTTELTFHAAEAANFFNGYEIITPGGMPNDTFIFSKKENLYFGTDLLTDHIEAAVLNLMGVTGDDVTRIIMKFSAGVQIVDLGSLAVARRSS